MDRLFAILSLFSHTVSNSRRVPTSLITGIHILVHIFQRNTVLKKACAVDWLSSISLRSSMILYFIWSIALKPFFSLCLWTNKQLYPSSSTRPQLSNYAIDVTDIWLMYCFVIVWAVYRLSCELGGMGAFWCYVALSSTFVIYYLFVSTTSLCVVLGSCWMLMLLFSLGKWCIFIFIFFSCSCYFLTRNIIIPIL